jgi:hypothetical protein
MRTFVGYINNVVDAFIAMVYRQSNFKRYLFIDISITNIISMFHNFGDIKTT